MAVRIRLQRMGKKGKPFYRIVVADSRTRRDGKFIELIGNYNPTTVPAQIALDVDKAVRWLQDGAEPTNTVNAILRYKGVLYKKHLLRGVAKGAFDMEVAESKFAEWVQSHQGKVLDHQEKAQAVKDAKHKAIIESGAAKAAARLQKAAAAQEAANQSAEEATEAVTEEVSTETTPEVETEATETQE